MVDKYFNGIQNISKYFPTSYWELLGDEKKKSSNLRPDTIIENDKEIFIVDSKMYKFGVTNKFEDLPSTSSINKQITYGDFIANNVQKNKNIRNVFIMPYKKNNNSFDTKNNFEYFEEGNIVYIGKAIGTWRSEDKIKDHDYIFTFLIDFNNLLLNYNKPIYNSFDTIRKTINEKLLRL